MKHPCKLAAEINCPHLFRGARTKQLPWLLVSAWQGSASFHSIQNRHVPIHDHSFGKPLPEHGDGRPIVLLRAVRAFLFWAASSSIVASRKPHPTSLWRDRI